MKNVLILGMLLFGISAFGQEQREQIEVEEVKILTEFWGPIKIIETRSHWNEESDLLSKISNRRIKSEIRISNCSAGVMEAKDYPLTFTITGAIYTAEYIKYSPRY